MYAIDFNGMSTRLGLYIEVGKSSSLYICIYIFV